MNVHCIYCDAALKKSTQMLYGMRCLCDEDYRFLNIEEVLLGFHSNKVYLFDVGSNNVYDEKYNALQKSTSYA